MNPLFSLLCFTLGWIACLLCAGNVFPPSQASEFLPLVGPAVVAVLLAIQSFQMTDAIRTVRLIVVVTLLGTFLDSVLINLGVYWVAAPMGTSKICPLWISAMWVALGWSLHGWLNILNRQPVLSALFGAVGCVAVYLCADAAGAIGIDISKGAALLLFPLLGAILLPSLIWLSNTPSYLVQSSCRTKAAAESEES